MRIYTVRAKHWEKIEKKMRENPQPPLNQLCSSHGNPVKPNQICDDVGLKNFYN